MELNERILKNLEWYKDKLKTDRTNVIRYFEKIVSFIEEDIKIEKGSAELISYAVAEALKVIRKMPDFNYKAYGYRWNADASRKCWLLLDGLTGMEINYSTFNNQRNLALTKEFVELCKKVSPSQRLYFYQLWDERLTAYPLFNTTLDEVKMVLKSQENGRPSETALETLFEEPVEQLPTEAEKCAQNASKVPQIESIGTISKQQFQELMENEAYEEILLVLGTSMDELSALTRVGFNFSMSPIRRATLGYPRSEEFWNILSEQYTSRTSKV